MRTPRRNGFGAEKGLSEVIAVVGHPDLTAPTLAMLEYDPSDGSACAGADESLLRSCVRLFAVWDGSPSTGRDSTARLVAFARDRGIDVEALWPDGASRMVLEKASGRRSPSSPVRLRTWSS